MTCGGLCGDDPSSTKSDPSWERNEEHEFVVKKISATTTTAISATNLIIVTIKITVQSWAKEEPLTRNLNEYPN